MENTKRSELYGFTRGLQQVYSTRTAAEYARCLAEVREVCMSTEERGSSRSSYYNKMNGRMPMSVAEAERIAAVFAKYGVKDWCGCENGDQNSEDKTE